MEGRMRRLWMMDEEMVRGRDDTREGDHRSYTIAPHRQGTGHRQARQRAS
jgi:hypothetical protein